MAIQTQHWHVGSTALIELARDDTNNRNTGGAIGLLPGAYNLKSTYRKDLEIDPETSPIPLSSELAALYGFYISSPNASVFAIVPYAARLYGEATAIINDATFGWASAFRGGMFYLTVDAARTTLFGLDIDGAVDLQDPFDANNICGKEDLGNGCWALDHKGIYTHSTDARILDCIIRRWAGEMVFGGSQQQPVRRLELARSILSDNQVSAISGTWQFYCHHNEFLRLEGQCQEGLHQDTCRYYDNYFDAISGGGINILGPVTGLAPTKGWWVNISGNIFANGTSNGFGGIYLSKQTTPDVSPPENTGCVDNVFIDNRTCISASLGGATQTFAERNLCVQDGIVTMDGINSKGGGFDFSLFRDNTFYKSANAIDAGYTFRPGEMSIGPQTGQRFVGNYYRNTLLVHDSGSLSGAPTWSNVNICFIDELYEGLAYTGLPQKSSGADPTDVPIPQPNGGTAPMSTPVYAIRFGGGVAYYARLYVDDGAGNPLYPHGTELRLVGLSNQATPPGCAFLIDGRGCRLKSRWPVILGGQNDYVLLKYDANLQLWVEMERVTPAAQSLYKLSHRGTAANRPLLSSAASLVIDSVNVIDESLWGWPYYETDTGLLKVYTASGWQTYWTAA